MPVCVPDCQIYHTHTNSLQSRECVPACTDPSCRVCGSDGTCVDDAIISSSPCELASFILNSGGCSSYACPVGYYRQASDKKCKPCHASCTECGGPQDTECISCEIGHALHLIGVKMGRCQAKSTLNSIPEFQIFVDHN